MSHYPRERVESLITEVKVNTATRLIKAAHARTPLGVKPSPSRFCPGSTFAVLYGAESFETAFSEVVVRDRFVQKSSRIVPVGEITTRSWVWFNSDSVLRLLDLGGDGCVRLGAPTDAHNARSHAAGRALAQSIYDEHSFVDGIIYDSRLTGGTCLAIFDRACDSLSLTKIGQLHEHILLPATLRRLEIKLSRS